MVLGDLGLKKSNSSKTPEGRSATFKVQGFLGGSEGIFKGFFKSFFHLTPRHRSYNLLLPLGCPKRVSDCSSFLPLLWST